MVKIDYSCSFFCVWHLSHKLQDEQPHEQEPFPCFFLRISLKTIMPKTSTTIPKTIAVGKLKFIINSFLHFIYVFY